MSNSSAHAPTRSAATAITVAVTGVVVAALALALPVAAQVSDTISIIKEGEDPSTAEVATRLVEEAPLAGGVDVDTVIVGRDDLFADSLASATMQDDGVLLLVPPDGPVPTATFQVVDDLAPERVVLLGGPQAISSDVEQAFTDRGLTVQRRAGASRIDTAVEIAAREAPEATTAILARGFPSQDSNDPTQAFADAISAGGWAADRSWVVLLTQTEVLTGATRDYLASSAIERVEIMGGTAAVSGTVEAELQDMGLEVARTAGPDRFGTAVDVAAKRGADSGADTARILLVDGQSELAWAGGFASAAFSAALDAPMVLANGDDLPASTEEWLSGTAQAFAQSGQDPAQIRLLCVSRPAACDRARAALDLPAAVQVDFDPADGAQVEAGSEIALAVTEDPDDRLAGPVEVAGVCVEDGTYQLDQAQRVLVPLLRDATGYCEVTWDLVFDSEATQTVTSAYTIG